jgi:hypothetical protein
LRYNDCSGPSRSSTQDALAGTRAQRRTRSQRARAHPETGAKWRRDVAKHVATAGTAAVITDGAGGIGAKPVAARVAKRIDALNGKAGQILHSIFPSGPVRNLAPGGANATRSPAGQQHERMTRIVARGACGVKTKHHNM